MRRLRRSKRGAGDEAFETPPYLAIAAILVLFTLGLAVRWFWMLFIAGPSVWDGYAIANFDRLGDEIHTMLDTGKWDEARVIPYSLYAEEGENKRRSLVGINPGMAPPESEGCRDEGEIQFNKVCKRYPCLCLCEATDCTDKKQCRVFKKSEYKTDVRFVGIDQEGFNTGEPVSGLTDWNDEPLHELVLYSRCGAITGKGWGSEFDSTGNLYIEETRTEDGHTYVLIARADDVTQKREEAIKERVRQQEEEERKRQEEEERRHAPGGGGWERTCGIKSSVRGIDISYHQGVIDWEKVAADGIDFAFIRASRATVSDIGPDTQFSNNWRGAKANGIKRGAYHFFRSDKDAETQAEIFLDQLGSDYGEFPPVIDVEMDSVNPYPFSRTDWINGISTWTEIVESRTGMKPIIYTGYGFWAKINTEAFSDHTLWVAHWTEDECPTIPSAWDDWMFWQTCEGCASVDGIERADGTRRGVDANVFNGDMDQLVAYVQQAHVI